MLYHYGTHGSRLYISDYYGTKKVGYTLGTIMVHRK